MSGGKSAKVSGAYDRTLEQLHKAGVEVAEFAKVMENPVKEMVMEGAAFAKENGCDFIVTLGGGAVLDSAVAVAAMATKMCIRDSNKSRSQPGGGRPSRGRGVWLCAFGEDSAASGQFSEKVPQGGQFLFQAHYAALY